MWRRITCLFLIIVFSHGFKATAAQYAFEVFFTNKNNTPYRIDSPLVYLSHRALARRAVQGIVIDSSDLPVNHAYIDSVLRLTGGILHETSRWLNMAVILIPDSANILLLNSVSFVGRVKLVGYYSTNLHRLSSGGSGNPISATIAKRTTSTDAAYFNSTWTQTQIVNGNFLYDNGYQGQGKLIALMDAGFTGTNTHPGFDSMWHDGRVVDTFNFDDQATDVFSQDPHGTEVLSTIAGNVPGTFVGSAPLAMFALYITEINSSEQPLELDNMLSASERADSVGADVISESLGYDLFDNPADGQLFDSLDGKTTIAALAANWATRKGILFVATAGNDGSPPVPGWGNHILTPGDADSALTIGAVDNSGNIAPFSGFGPNAAGFVKPDVCGVGDPGACFDASSGGYTALQGTSLSTPQIAGWAACLMQANPTSTPFQVRQAIIRCASMYNSPGVQFGYGIPNFECTNIWLGISSPLPPFTKANWIIATPNPFYDDLTIDVFPDSGQDINFRIFDLTGKQVFSAQQYFYKGINNPVTFSLAAQPPGIYILKAVSQTQQDVVKIEKR